VCGDNGAFQVCGQLHDFFAARDAGRILRRIGEAVSTGIAAQGGDRHGRCSG
jgi:hypothetical protein